MSCTRSGCGGSSYTGFIAGVSAALLAAGGSAALLAAGGVVAADLPCRFGYVGLTTSYEQ